MFELDRNVSRSYRICIISYIDTGIKCGIKTGRIDKLMYVIYRLNLIESIESSCLNVVHSDSE